MSIKSCDKNVTIRACRICLDSKCVDMISLDEENGWLKLFEYCFGISLTTDDNPRILCDRCANKVTSYAQFKEQCKKSNNLWKSVTCKVKCYTDNVTLHCKVKTEDIEDDTDSVKRNDDKTHINFESFDILNNGSNLINDGEASDFISTNIKDRNIKVYSFDEKNKDLKEKHIDMNFEKQDKNKWSESIELNVEDSIVPESDIRNEYSNDSINSIVKKYFKCKICKKKYERIKWLLTHVKACETKKQKTPAKGLDVKCEIISLNENDNKIIDQKGVANIKTVLQGVDEVRDSEMNEKDCENPDISILFCGLCKCTFTSTNAESKHLVEHWSNNDLQCRLCEFVGGDLAAIAVHRFTHCLHKRKKTILCHICKKRKNSLLALEFHYRHVHLKKSGGMCFKCNKEFTSIKGWRNHEKTHSCAGYICDICGKRFIHKYLIRNHINDHTNLIKHICHACGKSFKRSWYLKLHIMSVHAKTGPIKCSHCNRMFKSEHTLNIHQKFLAKKKTVKCEVCLKEFPSPTFLKTHMVMHSEERPYNCDICGSKYKAKGQLKVHMRNHTGYMPFKCGLCTKSFPTSKQLKVHTSVHTGIRAHSCLYCHRTFHSKKLMLSHCALCHVVIEKT